MSEQRTRKDVAMTLLGVVLCQPKLLHLNDVVSRVTTGHMPNVELRHAWRAIQDVISKTPVEALQNELALSSIITNGTAENVSHEFLTECMVLALPSEIARVEETATAVIKYAMRQRRLDQLEAARKALQSGEPLEAVDEALIAGATQMVPGQEIDHDATAALKRVFEEEPITGLSTGIKWLDETTGGILLKELWLIGGRYKGGKTRTARHIFLAWLRQGAKCSFYAVEGTWLATLLDLVAMLATQYLMNTSLESQCSLSGRLLRRMGKNYTKLTPEQQDAIKRARKQIKDWQDNDQLRIYTKEKDHGAIFTVDDMRRQVRLDAAQGYQYHMYDYAQRFQGKGSLFDSMREVAFVSQDIVQQHDVALVGLVQRNEATNEQGDDLGGSAGIKGGGDLPASADTYLTTSYHMQKFRDAKQAGKPHASMTLQLYFSRNSDPDKVNLVVNRTSGMIIGPVPTKKPEIKRRSNESSDTMQERLGNLP